ncbi:MAG TPA: hypothetical protein VK498_05350 [Ferruginibacter sp.]|nr:hypothetical protein [Ferruginibacter sp.]
MNKFVILIIVFMAFSNVGMAQSPCRNNPVYRQFDFWIGDWEAFGPKGKKAGDSKISLILDSCIVLEEWTSSGQQNGLTYKGKSFNTYNAITGQWQQTWVDNTGGSTEYLEGKFETGKIIFNTRPFALKKDTMAIRKLTFFNLGAEKVRQLGEISKDNGNTWLIEFDLEYRRKSSAK